MKPSIQRKLQTLVERHEEVSAMLSDASVISKQNQFRELSKEYAQLEPIVNTFKRYQASVKDLEGAKELLNEADAEMQQLAKQEAKEAEEQLVKLESDLQILLLPRDPHDDSNIFLEIRAGAGGDEASIFSGDLARMYTRYAESQGWQVEPISMSNGEHGGYKEIIMRVLGQGAYSRFKFESGVHRVQRVPETEAQGEFTHQHARLPFYQKWMRLKKLSLILLIYARIRFVLRAGGQHVKTDSAIRITHIPTEQWSNAKTSVHNIKIAREQCHC